MADILIVDDDDDLALAIAEAMEDEGHTARLAYHGEQGLRHLARRLADLVLLDVDMPVLDGPGMVARMAQASAAQGAIPIVLISGIPGLPDVASQVGTPYFLSKPYRLEDLLDVVARALRERRPAVPPGRRPP